MTLSPESAAKIADAVYGIRTTTNIAQGVLDRGVRGLDTDWDLGAGSVASGRSGGGSFSARSGFALVLNGRGQRAGERVVAVRGTVSGYDWLSNANAASDRGPNGYQVHAGFHRVYRSIIDQVLASLGTNRSGRVHVIGHSLGGAIANNVAARLYETGFRNLELYTFGAPRAGMPGFARALTRSLGSACIHRVYNLADPVPLVPIFPYRHAPSTGEGIRVGGSAGGISIEAHYMSSYTPLVASQNWRGLSIASQGMENRRNVDYWLGEAQRSCRIPGGSYGLWVLGHALRAILSTAERTLGLAIYGGATLVDTLASLMARAAELSLALSRQIVSFIGMVCRWAGRAAQSGANLTARFIAYILGLVLRPLAASAQRALSVVVS